MTSDEARALTEQAHQIEELAQHPGWAVYTDYLRVVVMAPVTARLLNDGGVETIEAYKKMAGYLAGAQSALDAPHAVRKLADTATARLAEERQSQPDEDA